MSTFVQSRGPLRFLLFAAVGLVLTGLPLVTPSPAVAKSMTTQDYGGQDPAGQEMPGPDPFGQVPDDDLMPRRSQRAKTSKKKSLTSTKAPATKPSTAKNKTATSKKSSTDSGQIKFSQDIAPILVANCVNCHSGDAPGLKRGKLDLSTFEKLIKGSQKRKDDAAVVIAGKPDESHLVLRINGDEEPRMPQGGNNRMSDDAIALISRWVKEGANLDEGIDPKKPIASYAASPAQVAKNKAARMPAQERDKLAESAGLERWKTTNDKLKPVIERSDHFLIFSNLPSDRAKTTIKAMETQYSHLKRLVGSSLTDWPEKLSIYVFANRTDFVSFVRAVENPQAEAEVPSSAKFAIPQPYLAIADPGGGSKEEPGAGKRKARSKRGESKEAESGGADRGLIGELTEALGTNVVASSGTAPRWLAQGIGTYLASRVEPRSNFYKHLRQAAFAEFGQGWRNRASEALGATDRITSEGLQAIGFALVEAMMSGMSQGFPDFVQGMLQGGDKLDDVLKEVYGGTREEFLDGTADWVASHYGRLE